MTSLWLSRGGIFSLWHSFYYWISFNKSYHLFYFEIQSNQWKNCKYLTEWLSELKAPDWVSLVIMFQTSSQWPSNLSFASSLLSLFCCIQQVFFQLKLSQGLTLVSSYSYQLNWPVLLQSWLPYHPLHSFWDNFQVLTQVLSQLLAKFLSSFSGGSVRSYSTLLIIKKATLVIAMYFPWFKLNLQTRVLSQPWSFYSSPWEVHLHQQGENEPMPCIRVWEPLSHYHYKSMLIMRSHISWSTSQHLSQKVSWLDHELDLVKSFSLLSTCNENS